MNNQKFQVEVDPNEDTEWNDILREKGIIPEKPRPQEEQLQEVMEEVVQAQRQHRLDGLDLEDLAELEDLEDEGFLHEYQERRRREMQAAAAAARFGAVVPVLKPEYTAEVTQASADGTVVWCHMSLGRPQSRLLAELMTQLARKYPEVKFCDIAASRAVEGYPESNTPTIVVYRNGDVVRQYVTLMELGGGSTTLHDLEKVLVDVGAVVDGDRRMENDSGARRERLRFAKKVARGSDSEDDWD